MGDSKTRELEKFEYNQRNMELEFDCLIKDLIILSYEKEDQINLIGFGNVGPEMLINFGISCINLSEFVKREFIDETQKAKLEQFNIDLIDNVDLDDNLDSEEWKKIRKTSSEILKTLNVNNYKVELDKSGKYWEAKLIKRTAHNSQ
jgi:hypothetical protein